jgi:hypothetical protein|tara:strand:- start:4573 stop:6345 length:1773 start_codon:yes stop_codon:yes gene_type:complete
MSQTIFDFIKSEEVNYEEQVELSDGWSWNMKEHLNRSFAYLNSQFAEDNGNRWLRPFKNIVLPILNIQFRTEGFDVKDIQLYADNPDEYFKSLLIQKFHDKWALENDLDTFIDEMVESYGTYGAALIRKTKQVKPEVINLRSLAFANQFDLLNNPFAILHKMSFPQLRSEAKLRGWGEAGSDIEIEDLIALVKKEDRDFVEVYEVHGSMPVEWMEDDETYDESEMDVNQVQIVAFYMNEQNERQGVTLFRKEMPELPFKLIKRDNIYNRALGRGGVEELFEPQQWTNWDEIWSTEMKQSASKTLFASDDPTFKSRNNLNNAQNNEVFKLNQGNQVSQIDTFPRNLGIFNDSIERWQEHAQQVGAASDPLLGETPSAGTPFKLFEAQQMESKSLHRYRQGKLAVFMDELYRDWILPHMAKEISKEQTFMEELSADEMLEVVSKILIKRTNHFIKQKIFSLQIIDELEIEEFKEKEQINITKEGNKRFFKILKDEMKDIDISVMTNIAGKQKNLALLTDKLVNVLRQYIATPEIRQDPEMTKVLNVILESSGLSPVAFGLTPGQAVSQGSNATQSIKELGQGQLKNQQQSKV